MYSDRTLAELVEAKIHRKNRQIAIYTRKKDDLGIHIQGEAKWIAFAWDTRSAYNLTLEGKDYPVEYIHCIGTTRQSKWYFLDWDHNEKIYYSSGARLIDDPKLYSLGEEETPFIEEKTPTPPDTPECPNTPISLVEQDIKGNTLGQTQTIVVAHAIPGVPFGGGQPAGGGPPSGGQPGGGPPGGGQPAAAPPGAPAPPPP
jgi:hypothetical protein